MISANTLASILANKITGIKIILNGTEIAINSFSCVATGGRVNVRFDITTAGTVTKVTLYDSQSNVIDSYTENFVVASDSNARYGVSYIFTVS